MPTSQGGTCRGQAGPSPRSSVRSRSWEACLRDEMHLPWEKVMVGGRAAGAQEGRDRRCGCCAQCGGRAACAQGGVAGPRRDVR